MKIVISLAYYETPRSAYNLKFFVENELKYRENIDYIIVINGMNCSVSLPELNNLTVIRRENTGFDFGAHSVALNYIKTNGIYYDYFVYLNSGVIGPIVPHYLKTHWSNFFIEKINDKVKLVGTTIVCLPHHDAGGYGPKIEGFFFVTDRVGMELIDREKTIFKIHETFWSAIVNGEYGLSNCIIRNGYSIDCMIKKYQGVDWSDKKNWNLNNNKHPSRKNSFYGNSLLPYELIFHKWYWKPGDPNYNTDPCNFELIKQYVENNC